MTTTTVRLGWLTLAALTAMTASACGHGTDAAAPPTTPPTITSPTTPAPPAEEAGGEFGQAPVEEQPPSPEPPAPQNPTGPAAPDCVSFDPTNLTVTGGGTSWIVRDGNHSMLSFSTKADAEDAAKVARNWRQLCFIGRGNTMTERYRYIITYYQTSSGLLVGAPGSADCIPYNPATLAVYNGAPHPADPDQADWALYSGGTPLVFLATEADALRAKVVAAGSTKLCVIGDAGRPMEYWRN